MATLSRVTLQSRGRAAWLAAYAVALFFAFPQPLAGAVVDGGLLLAWWVPACFLLGLSGLRGWRAARWAFAASGLAHAGFFYWFYVVTVHYGHAPVLAGLFAPLAPALYIALFSAVFASLWGWLEERGGASPFVAALLWVVLDHTRSYFLSGFPWATLGYAQHLNYPLLALTPWTGVYGLSFVSVLGGAAIAELVAAYRRGQRPRHTSLAALGLVAALLLLGWSRMPASHVPGASAVRVAALQGNIDQGVKWNRDWVERTLRIYEELSREAAAAGARVVVWPETAVPGALEVNPALRDRLLGLSEQTGATLVVGGVGVTLDAAGQLSEYFDSAFVVEPSGQIAHRYDKSHLVPFGEYVPFRSLIGGFLGAMASGLTSGDVTPGPRPRALAADASLARAAGADSGLKLALPICYELLFPDLMRRFARDGAGVLFALTNDAWYGRTGAPYQFLAMTALRAAESGLWVVRAANTGVSAIIDSGGRVRQRTAIFERGSVVANVPVRSAEAPVATFYARHGDVFAWLCWVALGLWAAAVGLRAARQPEST